MGLQRAEQAGPCRNSCDYHTVEMRAEHTRTETRSDACGALLFPRETQVLTQKLGEIERKN